MRQVTKGKLGEITFQLNPSQMTYDAGAVWATTSSPNMSQPITSYSHGRESTFSFELWVSRRHEQPINMGDMFIKLNRYRASKEPVLFAYGSFVCRVVVLECPFNIQKWNSNLSITDMRIPIKLRAVY